MLREKVSVKEWLIKHILDHSSKKALINACHRRLRMDKVYITKVLNTLVKNEKNLLEISDLKNRIKVALFILDNKLIKCTDLMYELQIDKNLWSKLKRDDELQTCYCTIKTWTFWGKPNTIKVLKQIVKTKGD
jgi:hypothetical protein